MPGATTGKIGINNTDRIFYLNQRVGKFEPKDDLDKSFLYYFLATKVEESLNISFGAAQPNLNASLALIDQNIEQAEALSVINLLRIKKQEFLKKTLFYPLELL